MAGKATNKNKLKIRVEKDMPDYSNDPSVIAKTEKAKAFLEKNGLPKDFQRKTK